MRISEKANDLLNKFGSTQFDFTIWNTPKNLAALDKARQEIFGYIAELEAKNERYIKLIQDWVDVLDPRYPQGDGLASAVRQAMLEINKESER